MISDKTKEAIEEHAEYAFPQECCGLLLNIKGKQKYFKCKNIAEGHEEQDFVLDPYDYAKAEDLGEILAVIHSHPNASSTPSEADKVSCSRSGLPWHIISWPAKEGSKFLPEAYSAPLTGRVFAYGVLDCQTLFIDYYEQEFGVKYKMFPSEYDWWATGKDYYADNWDSWTEGDFIEVKDHTKIEKHDVILMKVLSNVSNHLAIYLGNNMILHHLMGRLSTKDIYGEAYQKNTTHVLRHKSLC